MLEDQDWVPSQGLLDDVEQLDNVRVAANTLSDEYLPHHLLSFQFPKPIQFEYVGLQGCDVVTQVRFAI